MDSCSYMSDVPPTIKGAGFPGESLGFFGRDRMESAIRPTPTYSNRARFLADLREHMRAKECSDDDLTPPTADAVEAAKTFINGLVPGVLSSGGRIAVSHDGEINFFFGKGACLFQVLIDSNGLLSYHGERDGLELLDSEISAAQFPHLRLLTFLSG